MMNDKKRKILIFTNVFPCTATPNTGFYVFEQVKRLSKNFDVKVICARPTSITQISSSVQKETFQDIEIIQPYYRMIPKLGVFFSARLYYRSVKKIVKELYAQWKFDVILAYWTHPEGTVAGDLACTYNVPSVLRPRGSDINVFADNKMLRPMIRRSVRKFDRVIPVTKALMQKVKDLGVNENRLSYIHNGLDHNEFFMMDRKHARSQLHRDQNRRMVLYVGNFLPVKGIENYLKAIQLMDQREHYQTDFVFIGDGPLKSQIEQMKGKLKHTHIELAGTVSHDNLQAWMNAANMLCLPSLHEGCPNVILEAFACGLPVAASNVGGIPELIQKDCLGRVFNPLDPKNMAEKISDVLVKEWDRQMMTAEVKDCHWDHVADKLKVEIDQLVGD